MDGAILPINFYCRSARLCLKKAALSKKSHLYADELQHLKAFETLVLSTIPGHPLYPERKEEKSIVEIRLHLPDAKKRITEIERRTNRHSSGTNVKGSIHQTTPGNGDTPRSTSQKSSPPISNLKPQRNGPRSPRPVDSAPVKSHKTGSGSRSSSSVPAKSQVNGSTPRIGADYRDSQAKSQNKIRKSQRKQPDSPRAEQSHENGNPRMQEPYAFASKSEPSSRKSTPILQRLRSVTECLGGESPGRSKEKEKDKVATVLVAVSRETSPVRGKPPREMPRLKALGLVSSIAGKNPGKATVHLPLRFDNCTSPRNQIGSEDEPEFSNTVSDERLSPIALHMSASPVDSSNDKDLDSSKQLGKGASGQHRVSLGHYVSHGTGDKREMKEELSDRSFGVPDSPPQSSYSAEVVVNNGEADRLREVEQVAESQKRDEAAWTTIRLQEQFGEALKELGSLQDRDEPGDLAVTDKSNLHSHSTGPSSGYQPIAAPQRGHGGGRSDKMQHNGWKSELPSKGERFREIEEQEAYFQRGGGNTEHTVNGELEKNARTSPQRSCQKRPKARETSNGEHRPEDEHLKFASRPHSSHGSDKSDHKDCLRVVREDCERFREQMKLLKEMADDSRIREFALHKDIEPVAKRCVGEKNETGVRTHRDVRPRKSGSRIGKGVAKALDSGNESRGSDLEDHKRRSVGVHRSSSRARQSHAHKEHRVHSKNKNKAKNSFAVKPATLFSLTSASSSSSSSTSSSLSSIPLSHYIQKLKQLAPDSKFSLSPNRSTYPGNNYVSKTSSEFPHPVGETHHKHQYHIEQKTFKTIENPESVPYSGTPPAAILLPKSPPSSHTLSARIQQRIGHLYKGKPELSPGRHGGSDQRLDAVLGGCALVASHLQRISPERSDREDKSQKLHHKSQKCLSGRDGPAGHDCMVSYVPQNLHKKQSEAFDGSMASLQRLVGELKGSVEGFKLRIEVESEGWRSRVEGLEKEFETLKDETDDELMEMKKCIRNEVKARLGELSADVERIRKVEKDQVDSLVQQRIESHVSGNNSAMVDLKNEIRSLWTEVENLSKEREGMREHLERLAQCGEEARETTNREIRNLRRDLRCDEDRGDTKATCEKGEMKQALEKIKDEGMELKMEVNSLKKVERVMKVEMENVKKLVEKLQEDTEEMERDRGAAQMEGVRERLLIMERVESLSQLYLGGLEEVRTDVYNVKFSCRDRMDELESQWGEYRRQQEIGSHGDHSCMHKQRLLHEMEHFRSEIADVIQTERGLLRETLEREYEHIRRQMIELGNSNKNELACMINVEMQKRVQAGKEISMASSDPMRKDISRLKLELDEAKQSVESVGQTLAMVERDRAVAARAAAEATSAAAKAGEVLAELLGPFTTEMTITRRKSVTLQETLSLERETTSQALAEAKKKSIELQEFLEQEKIRMKNAVAMVQSERDAAAAAATEASNSAVKAGEFLDDVLGSLNQEMSKGRRKSIQLQEGLDREREILERDREEVIRKSQEAQERFNEELERAITSWKRAMNQEVAKAKGVIAGLEEDRQRQALSWDRMDGHNKVDHDHVSRTNEALASLRFSVKDLQESAEISQEEKRRRRSLKQNDMMRKNQDQEIELNSLREKIEGAIEREENLRDLVDQSAKRMKKLEESHVDLVQSFEKVRASTGDLEKTASIWLPKYENAARIVNDMNCKVEKLEEKCKAISADEGLMQKMAHVAECKVQSLKEMVAAGPDLKDLFQKLENGDQAHSQAMSMLETRVSQLESVIGHEKQGLSLKLEYIEKRADFAGEIPNNLTGVSESIEALQRKLEFLTSQRHNEEEKSAILGGSDLPMDVISRLNGLESRIELVASATFTNLRLLDAKVEECTSNTHQALEGAATAENKCSALGAELVKVFRMLASSRQASPAVVQRTRSPPSCGRDHSPTKTQPTNSPGPSPPRARSPLVKKGPIPKSTFRRAPTKPRTGSDFARSTMASEMRKVIPRNDQLDAQEEFLQPDRGDPPRDKAPNKDQRLQIKLDDGVTQALCVHEKQPIDKGVQEVLSESATTLQEGEIKGLGRLTVSQDRTDEKHKDGTSKCQRTKIMLEAGRIHVNVSHRSGVATGSRDKRADLVPVQS